MQSPSPPDPSPAALDALAQVAPGLPQTTQHLLAGLLTRRGPVDGPAALRGWLDPAAYTPAGPTELPDLEQAAERLLLALERGERICVWGDFDVDGQTATSVLVEALTALGGNVSYHIPVRASESHGVRREYLAKEIEAGAQVVLTCDTGVTAHEALEWAEGQGVAVLVTDHHELGETLPKVSAVVNPRRLAAGHSLGALPGVGVAWQLVAHLAERTGHTGLAEHMLDLTALGIVADLATLTGDTRYLLQRGLVALRSTERVGLRALYAAAELSDLNSLTEETIGFQLAPRLNAIGRLGDANPMVELLTTADDLRAADLAGQLEALNLRRKLYTDQVYRAALAQLEANPNLADLPTIVLLGEGWPGGVLGLAASRLVGHYQRPVVLLAVGKDGVARGSARSVEGVHITAAIRTQAALLAGFGGHPMAAGLAVPVAQFDAFRKGLNAAVLAQLESAARTVSVLAVDADLPLSEATLATAEALNVLAPFGPGNPAPVLVARDVAIHSTDTLGRTGEHLRVTVVDGAGVTYPVLFWQGAGTPLPKTRFDLAYALRATTFKGERQAQITWLDVAATAESPLVLTPTKHTLALIDRRGAADPLAMLKADRDAYPAAQVWAEAADGLAAVDAHPRHALTPSETLLVWTLPPAPGVWAEVLQAVSPQRVVVYGQPPAVQEARAVLERLAALVNYAVNRREGVAEIARLAGALALTEDAVRAGLLVLQAQGAFVVTFAGEVAQVGRGAGSVSADREEVEAVFRAVLREITAYRQYVRGAALERVVLGLVA